jgi:hypothetical protein
MYKKNTTGEYRGIPYDSLEELAFLQWAFELKSNGHIVDIGRGKSYLLSPALYHDYAIQLKTKSKPASEIVLHGHSYNPDFQIRWADDEIIYDGNFTQEFVGMDKLDDRFLFKNHISIIEVKPDWDSQNMERLFKLNQKWMWDKLGVYVNLVKPKQLFQQTFTPREYLKTPTGKPKKIGWKPRSLEEFLKVK